jgi:hypothetical protein
MKNALCIVSLAALICIPFAPARAQDNIKRNYYLKADFGMSLPLLEKLDEELKAQGSGGVAIGYGFGVTLARAFAEKRWALEFYFAVSYHPEFTYLNDYKDFPGDLRHSGFGAAIKRRFRAGAPSFVPSLGLGFGYGTTNLISGGGKIAGAEAIALLEIETWTWGNKSVLFNCTYTVGLTEDTFENPFLENVEGDVVRNSSGDPLGDRYSSLQFKVGILIWLGPLGY